MPRPMRLDEIEVLLQKDTPIRLATLDRNGFPHITPLWFVWSDDAFHMTSLPTKPHVRRLRHNSRVGVVVDTEVPERADRERLNQQVRAIGRAVLQPDPDGTWTRLITEKYLTGPGSTARISERSQQHRVLIQIRPARLTAVASI